VSDFYRGNSSFDEHLEDSFSNHGTKSFEQYYLFCEKVIDPEGIHFLLEKTIVPQIEKICKL
jgi:hypothetical protein